MAEQLVATREIKEENRVWKFNTIVLYDLVMTHTLEWPSLTVEWVPGKNFHSSDEASETIIIGTHTADGEPNFVLIVEIMLPQHPVRPAGMHYDQRYDYWGYAFGDDSTPKFNINSRIPHQGEVNKARCCPQNTTKIATKCVNGEVSIFDSTKFGPFLTRNTKPRAEPEIVLKGHTAEGWGISWNKEVPGLLASVADDGLLCLWDIFMGSPEKHKFLWPLSTFSNSNDRSFRSPMQDLVWRTGSSAGKVCLSVSDNGKMLIWDIREDNQKQPTQKISISALPVTTISSNPTKEEIVATGGANKEIALWDMRKLKKPLHKIASHQEAVVKLQWSACNSALLASASSDRFVALWDMDRIGMEQTVEDSEDGPPELVFMHGGHTAPVSDICWNPEADFSWMIASVGEDNVLQIWEPSKRVFRDPHEGIDGEQTYLEDDFEVE